MEATPQNTSNKKVNCYSISKVIDVLLYAGAYLLARGAHSGRVMRNLERMASTWGYDIHLNSFFRGIALTVIDKNDREIAISRYLEAPPPAVQFSSITKISHLSWEIYEDKRSPAEAQKKIAEIANEPKPKKFWVAVAVGFSCAGLCLFSNGDFINAVTAFLGAFAGYLAKSVMDRHKYNPFIGIFIAALTTTLITGLFARFNLLSNQEAAIATAVLYLIPGVPLINVVIDMIEGYFNSALNRMLFAFLTILSISAGIWTSLTLLGLSYF
ncbi:MAG: threonine/serine exporter family protein [Dysgonamonadaceae bacterium]|jgi:uncharacterized membrane protein YjjP (DUF1212 family)|nr:threonine/serine exporter family protein [Dysgonamonadaceae bacterium]